MLSMLAMWTGSFFLVDGGVRDHDTGENELLEKIREHRAKVSHDGHRHIHGKGVAGLSVVGMLRQRYEGRVRVAVLV